MKLFELCINEVFDTKVPVDNWIKKGDSIIGNIVIDHEQFQIIVELQHYKFNNESFNFLNIAFAKMVNGIPSQLLTITSKNSSKILGAIFNAVSEKTKELSDLFNIKAIVFVARDNVSKRMSVYNRMASNMFSPFSVSKTNIPLPKGGRMAALFRDNIDPQLLKSFIEFVDSLQK
jgi:prophage DNA circulation protein